MAAAKAAVAGSSAVPAADVSASSLRQRRSRVSASPPSTPMMSNTPDTMSEVDEEVEEDGDGGGGGGGAVGSGDTTEDSDFPPSRPYSPSSTTQGFDGTSSPMQSPSSHARTTVTTTSISRAGGAGQSTTVQYSGAASVSQNLGKDGVLHIRPIPLRKGRSVRVKKVVNFTPRISTFDRFHPTSQGDTFRGFFVLFWLLTALVVARMFCHSYLQTGEVVGMRFARLISADGITLALSDGVMVASTFLVVPFAQLMERGWIRYNNVGLIIQHVCQTVFLGIAIRWTFYREWYWVQSGYLTLHSLVMLMKVHSYISYNGNASEKRRKLQRKTAELDKAVEAAGGWDQVLEDASTHHAQTVQTNGHALYPVSPTRSFSTGDIQNNGTASSESNALLHRRPRRNSKSSEAAPPTSSLPPLDREHSKDPRHLVDFHDDKIYNLANDCVDLVEDLTSTGKEAVKWPANLTYANYWDYLLVPTLVYELEYPRTTNIRPLYVIEKTLATFGTFAVIYSITAHVILPLHEANQSNPIRANNFFAAALDLVLPFIINYLLIFYIIFECICNGFAELTRFADRGFYEDWWNAVTWEEFARKWNKPVHQFLLRHVYASTIAAFRLSKFQASFLTFLLSACVHELVMAVVSKKFRMYLFVMQMLQLPLIMAGRLPIMRKYPTLGNIFFWTGLIWGTPLLAVGYLSF